MWSEFIRRNGNVVTPVRKFAREELDDLSEAEFAVATEVWRQFGHMSASQFGNDSHENCPEYTETARNRIPIAYRDIMEALGDPDAESIDKEIRDVRRAEGLLVA